MKKPKYDAKRQERRSRTLARLEAYLKGGVKQVVDRVEETGSKFSPNKGLQKFYKPMPFSEADVERMEKEIDNLKLRLEHK